MRGCCGLGIQMLLENAEMRGFCVLGIQMLVENAEYERMLWTWNTDAAREC
jgi:hypothetical protein